MPTKPSTNGILDEFESPNYDYTVTEVAQRAVDLAEKEVKIVLARYGRAVVPVRPGIDTSAMVEELLRNKIRELEAADQQRHEERRKGVERRQSPRYGAEDRRDPDSKPSK